MRKGHFKAGTTHYTMALSLRTDAVSVTNEDTNQVVLVIDKTGYARRPDTNEQLGRISASWQSGHPDAWKWSSPVVEGGTEHVVEGSRYPYKAEEQLAKALVEAGVIK